MADLLTSDFLSDTPEALRFVVAAAIAVVLALVLHFVIMKALRRVTRRSDMRSDNVILRRLHEPLRWIFMAIALGISSRAMPLGGQADETVQLIEGLAVPALIGWVAIQTLRAFRDVVDLRTDISVADNLVARRKRTRAGILVRIGIFIVLFVTVALMLLSLPSVRNIGVSLLASAGLAGLAVGAAAQPALKNLIAGVQMAFTEPIRLDDAVIIAGEWGWIEEIRLTYVVVKVWDERRLIVPVTKFLEEPFQNWTRDGAGLLGSVFLYLDPTADIDRLRAHFEKIIADEPLWDGRGKVVQVTETTPDAIELRILATGKDSPTTFDLRCSIREKMLAFVRDEMPEALPRRRQRIEGTGETVEPA